MERYGAKVKILIVDDQRAIVESLQRGISWEKLEIDEVFTACSAKEAKLILVNFDIDILLTDIEMPEEDGLELFRWTREQYPEIVGIFLTSHADFDYAKEVISLGGFDYILQPARYRDVEKVLKAAGNKVQQNVRMHKLEGTTKMISQQRDSILELMLLKMREGRKEDNSELFCRLLGMFGMEYQNCVFWPVWIRVVHFERIYTKWDEKLIKLVFRNILEELFDKEAVKICIASEGVCDYLVFAAAEEEVVSSVMWQERLQEFTCFINSHMDFSVAVYPGKDAMSSLNEDQINVIYERKNSNTGKQEGIFWEDVEKDSEATINEERISLATNYIKKNINRNISRMEMAEMLHLNEEYFSRLFKRYTGYTFKDYEMMERISQAKKLLENSHFSISIIATKVGYDNFSHFSKVFKKMTGYTPQEWRRKKVEKS